MRFLPRCPDILYRVERDVVSAPDLITIQVKAHGMFRMLHLPIVFLERDHHTLFLPIHHSQERQFSQLPRILSRGTPRAGGNSRVGNTRWSSQR
jgi:hypothetical protein